MNARVWIIGLLVSPLACGGAPDSGSSPPDSPMLPVSGGMDPAPTISFTQVAKAVGIDRTNEPASAGPWFLYARPAAWPFGDLGAHGSCAIMSA